MHAHGTPPCSANQLQTNCKPIANQFANQSLWGSFCQAGKGFVCRKDVGMVQNWPILGNTFGGHRGAQFWPIYCTRKDFCKKVAAARVLPWFEPCPDLAR